MQKVRSHLIKRLLLLVRSGFQVYFTPLAGVLFTFPSRYWFTIGRQEVFSLTGWSPWILAGFHVSRDTQVPVTSRRAVAYGAVTLYGRSFQIVRLACWLVTRWFYTQTGPTTPPCKHDGLGYVRVRSPLLAESLLFSVPVGTEMVHFPTLPSTGLWIQPGIPRD